MKRITVSKNYTSYNGRRYGKPWCARIKSFNGSATLEFEKYSYNGNDNGGEIVITAEIGEVIKIGQKDNRSNKSDNDFYQITEAGLEYIADATEARKLWLQWQAEKNKETTATEYSI